MASGMVDEAAPRPGDLTLCIECGGINLITVDGTEGLKTEDLELLRQSNPESYRMIMLAQRHLLELRMKS